MGGFILVLVILVAMVGGVAGMVIHANRNSF